MKKIFRTTIFVVCMASCVLSGYAQIGYQISLLNTATGEPRANETVNVTVKLTNKDGEVIFTGSQSATSNDFGVLSLTIGDTNTFKNVDFSKLPFFVEVSANGVMIGKSQVLSVPVAEAANSLVPSFTKEELCSKQWVYRKASYLEFNMDGTGKDVHVNYYADGTEKGRTIYDITYEIEGNTIYVYYIEESGVKYVVIYRLCKGVLYIQAS